jgi:DNA-binding IclR family transcriptional regulator
MAANKACPVPSVKRALSVLELLAHSRGAYSVSEISRKLTLPTSSTFLITKTLENEGFLQKNTETGKYSFGLKLISLSRSALENLDLRKEARPFLLVLMQRTGLTVHMAILERNEAVIIEKIDCPGLVRLASFVGRRLDSHCTGLGKALVAFLPEEELEQQILARGFAKHNECTIVTSSALKREFAKVRELGYALDDEEDEVGVRCIGAPIFGSTGKVVAAISVSGTTGQIPIERVESIARVVRQRAADISSVLGHRKG